LLHKRGDREEYQAHLKTVSTGFRIGMTKHWLQLLLEKISSLHLLLFILLGRHQAEAVLKRQEDESSDEGFEFVDL
jgi:hypothetical protein